MTQLHPISENKRINSLDLLRGVAVLGILLINIVGLGLPDPAYFDPSGYGGNEGWNLKIFILNSIFFEGAMRGLFAMLFGCGILLFVNQKEKQGAGLEVAQVWYRRLILLILMGMIHAYILIWPGDILFSYGMIGLLLFPFRNIKSSMLILMAVLILLLGAGAKFNTSQTAKQEQSTYFKTVELFNKQVAPPHGMLLDYYAWIERYAVMKPTDIQKQHRIKNMQSGYLAAAKEMAPDSYFFESDYHYSHQYFDILSMMLLGMALFKLSIFHATKSYRFYGLMLMIGYGIGIPINWWETQTYINSNYDLIKYYELLITYDLGRIPIIIGHIGLIMLLAKANFFNAIKRSLVAVGRMALSNYLGQTIIANLIFIGLGQYGQFERHELYYIVLGIWAFQLVASPLWLKHFTYGPFEWLWRSLTYGKRQTLKR